MRRLGLSGLAASLAFGFALMAEAAPSPATAPPVNPAAAPSPAPGEAVHTLDRADLETWLDGMVPYALKTGDIAGMVIVVVKDGRVLLQKGYGYADVTKKTPMDPAKTMIRPGSTSKLFTWTAVMQLVQAGKLDLDRDVNSYLDFKIPERFGKPVTLRDLMNHRAGFEEGLKDILTTDPHALQTNEQYLKDHPRPMLFAPGEAPAYSNYGAALAGYIVQRVSGEPFARYMEHHIFLPLGMTDSTFDQPPPARFTAAMSNGYRTASGAPMPYELLATAPAGSVTTTAVDMSRFMLAQLQQGSLNGYQMLSPAAAALMQSPSEPAFAPGFDTMAHGFFYQTRNGHLMIGHGGDTIVFHTEMDLLPKDDVGIFYSFNSRGADDAVYGARQGLLDGFMDRYFPAPNTPPPPTLASAPKDAQEIAGLYQSSRRIEHGFLSFFYLLQQTSVTADASGVITAPDALGHGQKKFREIGPQLWRQIDGARELALTTVNGVKTIVDSEDPVTVLQATPFARSSSLNLNVLMLSLGVLFWTLALWPLSALLRRADRGAPGVSPEGRRLRLVTRVAAAVDVVWLFGWMIVLQPALGGHVEAFGRSLDPVVAVLQLTGFLTIIAALAGWWSVWRTVRADATWLSRVWTVIVALALSGVVWLGMIGKLIGLNLNY
jgi:CubicO group peptidase (beta-lactamase class C family)